MSGRTEGGNVERSPRNLISLNDSRHAARIALPFGSIAASELASLATTCDGIRFAPDRSILLVCADEPSALAALDRARQTGFIVDSADPRRSIAACPGAPACASAHLPTRAIAAAAARDMADLLDGSVSLHISGCAHPQPADIVLAGMAGGAGLGLSARASDSGHPTVAAPRAIAGLAGTLRANRRNVETTLDTLTRLGAEALRTAAGGRISG